MGYSLSFQLHQGTRPSQQDSIMVPRLESPLITERGCLVVLCDGMGGLSNGALASRMCTDLVMNTFYNRGNSIMNVPRFYREIVRYADEEVAAIGAMGAGTGSCGTTIVSACMRNDELYICAVGDSRLFLVRDGTTRLLNQPHRYSMELQTLIEKGEISKEDAERDPQKDSLVSFIGMGGVKYIDMNEQPIVIRDRDLVVLCSDGISERLTGDDILSVTERVSFDDIPNALINSVLSQPQDDFDNMSVIALRWDGEYDEDY